ncbi:DUF3347 domain-containing protein [Cyclobacterium qasimii]|uniref:DUF3347 domain-containing protein n=2 Tax=Cyclobacterium qasimii TaxID=1350429 RepID=S7VG14_9BACT|nr:DUF3347 domain-containing protein [Cyclobacterium qasimii]EPR68482.1 hypothetical protein ADICYQ_2448 [Cyclobacterium qasimii M12-11B]GEO23728.1 hypothetical protein CQA01_42620 [Cyclobacterium qasimii]
MKIQKSILSTALIAGLSLSLIACSENKKAEKSTVVTLENLDNQSKAINGEPTKTDLIDGYLEIKKALTEDNSAGAVNAAVHLEELVQAITFKSLTQEQLNEVNANLEIIKEHSEQIKKNEIDLQIAHFEGMGKNLQDLLSIVGSDRKLYQQHCPMFNKNEGGMWLSENEEIINPLFKGEMSACGAVKEVIEAG